METERQPGWGGLRRVKNGEINHKYIYKKKRERENKRVAAEGADEEVGGDSTPGRVVTMTDRHITDRRQRQPQRGHEDGPSTAISLLVLLQLYDFNTPH